MAETKEKPDDFKAGQPLRALDLSQLRAAIPRLLTGGTGISVKKVGDKYVVSLSEDQGVRPGSIHIATITAVFDTYLQCRREGQENDASIWVAKPWGLRRGVAWPSGATYSYSGGSSRTATSGATSEAQVITPAWMVGEQILAVRLAAARIMTNDEIPILWEDINQAGRCWATSA